jgi:exonuclease SbcD
MRLIHTADWHLGHTLAGHSRQLEHERFLSFLLDTLEVQRADALFISGDVYDHGHPAAFAQRQFFGFVAEARRRLPALAMVVIGGNHDTAARLDAAGPVLRSLGVAVLGGFPRAHDDTRGLAFDDVVIPLRVGGDVAAVAVAVPFLRAPELSMATATANAVDGLVADLVVDGTRAVLERVSARARALYPRVPVLALAHCELAGARLSLSSERPLFGGSHALPADLFDQAGIDYAALGHLHLAQHLGPSGNARYSGSPMPLSMAERHYQHQVVVVDVADSRVACTPVFVPRTVDFLRVPDDGADDLEVVLDRLRSLDLAERSVEERPFLEVRVRLSKPVPDLRARVDQALEGKPVRLVRVERESDGDGLGLSDLVAATAPSSGLMEFGPVAVFSALYSRHYEGPPEPALLAAFASLVEDDARAAEAPIMTTTTTPNAVPVAGPGEVL